MKFIIQLIIEAGEKKQNDPKSYLLKIHDIELYLGIYDVPIIINVNEYYGEFRVFDLFLDKLLKDDFHGDCDDIFRYFFRYDDLIITFENARLLRKYFNRIDYRPLDIYKLYVNSNIKKLGSFKDFIRYDMINAINERNNKLILYILSIPEYDMYRDDICDGTVYYLMCYPFIMYYNRCSEWYRENCGRNDEQYNIYHHMINSEVRNQIYIMQRMITHKTFKLSYPDFHTYLFKLKPIYNPEYPLTMVQILHSCGVMPTQLFIMIVAYSDNYLVIGDTYYNTNRFFNIVKDLPQELQMMIANYTYNKSNKYISSNNINNNLHCIEKIDIFNNLL